MNEIVLCLDLSLERTGFAIQNARGEVDTGAKGFPLIKRCPPAIRFVNFHNWIEILIEKVNPTQVVIEAAVCHGQGGNEEALIGARVLALMACAGRNIPVTNIYPNQAKLHAVGQGNAKEDAVKARAKELYPNYCPETDEGCDEADALLLLRCFTHHMEAIEAGNVTAKAKKKVSNARKRAKKKERELCLATTNSKSVLPMKVGRRAKSEQS